MTAPLDKERLRRDIAEVLDEDPADLGDDENLIDRGLDSIRVLMLSARWREDGHDIGFLDLADEPTIAAWASVADNSAGKPANKSAGEAADKATDIAAGKAAENVNP
ncbi:aryl carrier-like protein [Actinoplanes lutulentus]|uniref:Aryl carrier-like protein n=1 Tax=Actinoplanes lutulentus TaxID=1287878 RepID=A0A327ZF88_9ACTN|nr:phosphopantetheine-binding protein [Actinoplanes lutulentus]MBB2942554.1 aryl carrier-like protein [Actinoplanes lutulentus]RAK38135.1 aryl carrier-like protein [Actinoplanes lutulentus]